MLVYPCPLVCPQTSVPKHKMLTQAGPMLAHRLRRWPSIKPALVQRLVFAGSQSVSLCWESFVLLVGLG